MTLNMWINTQVIVWHHKNNLLNQMTHVPVKESLQYRETSIPHCLGFAALVLQAIFEVISSEHSYLHSLEILVRMFKNSVELSEAMTKTEHHHLFSNIVDVCEASTK